MPGNPLTDENWAPELADQITDLIGNIRDKTTNNAIKIVRGVVFGLLGVILGVVTIVLALVAFTRGLQSLIDVLGASWERAVYVSYFVLGGILTLAGLFLMGKRTSA
jgi:protein-S-isoprenylcysteine O-methyltransferase Ste14